MNMNSIMASQLRSLQSTVQLSVMNKALSINTAAVTDMLQSMQDQPSAAPHPHKGMSIDVKA
ncbi:putative motility protein [Sporosarcina highlanderae]|uniref:Motility protein n=1 Tax=Sporosarcina highlanderae TaxID=3035916 RepID=A0ABT8JRL7_9BACL|nr:putative motility protein [Sporosarcina highlanderae]MDN4607806.1 putative motility protein [Sporosarcina highlanderae]